MLDPSASANPLLNTPIGPPPAVLEGARPAEGRCRDLLEQLSAVLDATPTSAIAVLGLTSRPAEHADPHQIVTALRGHWTSTTGCCETTSCESFPDG